MAREPETAAAVPSYTAEAVRLGTLLRQAGLPLDDRLLRMLIISALPQEMESVQTHLLYSKDAHGNPLDLAATQKVLATAFIAQSGTAGTPEGVATDGRAAAAAGGRPTGTQRGNKTRPGLDNSGDVGAQKHRTQAKCKQKGCTNTPTPGFSFCKRCYQSFKEKQKEMKTSGTSKKLIQDDKEDYIKGFTLMLKSFQETSPNLHILDSGCNRTCITDPMIFDNLSKPDLQYMVQADGSKVKVEAMGPITMHLESGFIQIPDALYVPTWIPT